MVHYTQCPLCSSPAIQQVLTATDHTVSQQAFAILQCSECSLRFTQNVPSIAEIGAYYRSDAYISHSDTRKGLVNRLYHLVRVKTLKDKCKMVLKFTGIRKGNLLDLGAGTGAFAHTMQQAGWSVTGLEPDSVAVAAASSKYGLTFSSPAALFRLSSAHYDAITLWHVLEHVHTLHEYMRQLTALLKPEGYLFIAVPNYTSPDAGHYQSAWAAYDVPRHLYHFSPKAMKRLLSMHGLELVTMRPMWFDSFYVSLLSEQYKTGHPGFVKAMLNGMRSNGRALRNPALSSSIIYVTRNARRSGRE